MASEWKGTSSWRTNSWKRFCMLPRYRALPSPDTSAWPATLSHE
jgi:hypothetical protein